MKVLVHKASGDWVAMCGRHGEAIWCRDWIDALEAAYGHVAMHHPRLKPYFEVFVSDGTHKFEAWGIAE